MVIDEDAGTFSYRSCGCRTRQITRPLSEITLYAPNVDAWLDELTNIFDIETARRARKRELIEAHLGIWVTCASVEPISSPLSTWPTRPVCF